MSFAASRWVSVGLLMSAEEWKTFFQAFPRLRLYKVAAVVMEGAEELPFEEFYSLVESFATEIQTKLDMDLSSYRIPFSCALSESKESFTIQALPSQRVLLKPKEPVIQLRPLSFSISSEGKIQTKSWGKNHICWGIQMSYPQLFQDPATQNIIQALSEHPHGVLFKKVLHWIRHHTKSVFLKGQEKSAAFSLKVGKESVYLLSKHEQCRKNGVEFTV